MEKAINLYNKKTGRLLMILPENTIEEMVEAMIEVVANDNKVEKTDIVAVVEVNKWVL